MDCLVITGFTWVVSLEPRSDELPLELEFSVLVTSAGVLSALPAIPLESAVPLLTVALPWQAFKMTADANSNPKTSFFIIYPLSQ